MKCIIPVVMVVLLLSTFLSCSLAFADSKTDNTLLHEIRNIDDSFLSENNINNCESSIVLTPWGGEGQLLVFKYETKELGYVISIDDVILEFAEGVSPYSCLSCEQDEFLYYDFAGYCLINSSKVYALREQASDIHNFLLPLSVAEMNVLSSLAQTRTLSNVSPQLQGSTNCVAAALSNVMWYWGNHGYSALTNGKTFSSLKTTIANGFSGYYANNSVLSVANNYAQNYNIGFTGGANWNPSYSYVCSEINAGYPCMVGFASGSVYSSTVGHMTMCYGYWYNLEEDPEVYIRVADGHSSNMVERRWTTYNDCAIKLRIYNIP